MVVYGRNGLPVLTRLGLSRMADIHRVVVFVDRDPPHKLNRQLNDGGVLSKSLDIAFPPGNGWIE